MKTLEWWGGRGYRFHPKVSFVLTNHNMSAQTCSIVNDLRQFGDAEIIVIDDGSEHGHTKTVVDHLSGVNEFVLHFNDLFDVIVFNRAFGFAQGEYIVVLQDDDYYKGTTWIEKAVEWFDRDRSLAALGGRYDVHVSQSGEHEFSGQGDPRYAQAVNAAPMWFRR
ncbi:MAG: glycosyltransferase family A protein, partial [bacterium]